ncbi:MAG: flagellar biosynthesis/type III secretory pathway protein [Alcaligenaceae bacterium]|nr:flagellar biosynthesis/type III secretory pathway protein [Alcaligenaceae bacterium SAGV5]MPS55002.1 flagellar biosynthesis/type III secretory pathway protein [Alcaligenaceae bacterium SAGV3]MPT55596.1 flagellar biosynthesis/type III secretory pathway protein [Alcaligenaceae bacterium]
MDSFCVERISISPRLRARHGLLRSQALAVCDDAERAAGLVAHSAQEAADALLEKARSDAAAIALDEGQRVAEQAAMLLDGLSAAQERLLDGVERLALELAGRAFERLVADMAPAERIAAAVRRVREEAPVKLHEAIAWVHPDDEAMLENPPWEIRCDARLERGSCRLEASSGEWRASFELAAAALRQALAARAAAFAPDAAGIDES